jgi:hypothetical protein
MRISLFLTALSLTMLSLSRPAPAADLIHHDLSLTLDPDRHTLEAHDTVTLPPRLLSTGERSISFTLHGGLSPRSPTAGVLIERTGTVGTSVPLDTYRVRFSSPGTTFDILYGGVIDHPLEAVGEEYARGQMQTAGRIFPEGAYLSPRSAWYPLFGEELVTFSLTVVAPPSWDVVSQGERTRHDLDGSTRNVRWESPDPQDAIYLVAGPYREYRRREGRTEAMVFLRQPDETLANRYLEATLQYLAMYEELIGPYPYGKFALVENFWETGYGMPSFTLMGPKVIRFPFILHSSYPHEILHNWWGNSVYIDYSSGNWGEGLTAYLSDHLVKETRGQGAEYRSSTLQKYADYVLSGRDMALTEFRSRHGSVSEAVGYGKSLMLFHMLRRRLGDDIFVTGLQAFYRRHRYRTATFDDLRLSFEEASGDSLTPFFTQWVTRPGAPEFSLEGLETEEAGDGYILRAELMQVQPGSEPFDVDVPVAVTLADRAEAHVLTVAMRDRVSTFEISLPARPLRVDVDPEYDIFRRLHSLEIPPALTSVFGADRALIVLPSAGDDESLRAYRELARSLSRTGPGNVEIVTDDEVADLPPDRTVLLLGWNNRFFPSLLSAVSEYDVNLDTAAVRLEKTTLPASDHAFVVTARHPLNSQFSILWIAADNLDAIPGLGRKLPHYHKYSYLAFEGGEPSNVAKGRWPTTDSPLTFILDGGTAGSLAAGKFTRREPLAERTPLFSEQKMLETIRFLSSEDLEGRGYGSPGLDKASRYIAGKMKEYGLHPLGEDGDDYLQEWSDIAPEVGGLTLRNVIGVIPGTREEWSGQSIVVGAHYDHLGREGSDIRHDNEGRIHYGADDNASGVAVLLDLARVLGKDWKPERAIVFAAFSGEEAGRLGSRHAISAGGLFSVESCRGMINLDTVGRLGRKKLMILGGNSASEWVHIFRGAGFLSGLEVVMVSEDLDSSDHMSFQEAGIPAVQLFAGPHQDYHRPGDTFDKIDSAGLVRVAAITREVIEYLAGREQRLTPPRLSENAPPHAPGDKAGERRTVSLGTIPDFTHTGKGVRLDGVVAGSPAEKAGLRQGDLLLEINRRAVDSLRALADILRSLSPGDRVIVRYLREGSEDTVEARLDKR